MTSVFKVTYWGVMGTMPTPLLPENVRDKVIESIRLLVEEGCLGSLAPGPGLQGAVMALVDQHLPFHLRSTYGGNTTCIEVETPDEILIFDCGSGFRELGISLLARWRQAPPGARRSARVLISHAHVDHTFATPFFMPYYEAGCTFDIYALPIVIKSLAAVLDPRSALSRIYFPPTYHEMKGELNFHPITADNDFMLGSTRVRTYALNHPGAALAYRLDHSQRSIVIATDHEHPRTPDIGLAEFAEGADLLYTDGQYLQAEYDGTIGVGADRAYPGKNWGHSAVESCVKTGIAAGVRLLHVGHREPRRDDRGVAEYEKHLQKLTAEELSRANRSADSCHACVPYEGMRLDI